MALLLPLIFVLGCFALLVVMRQWLRLQKASPRTHAIFSLASLLGALLGVGLSLKFQYALGDGKRVTGAPLPVLLQKLEDGRWHDFPPPRHVVAALVVANSALTATAIAGPLFLLLALRSAPRSSGS